MYFNALSTTDNLLEGGLFIDGLGSPHSEACSAIDPKTIGNNAPSDLCIELIKSRTKFMEVIWGGLMFSARG